MTDWEARMTGSRGDFQGDLHVRPLFGQHPSLRCFGAARRASERNLFLPVGDFDCPNAHEPFAYGTDPVGRRLRLEGIRH
jgi:hypothetical protein